MLRLKQAINDCGIPQKVIVEATGFGKTQVSLTLSSGKLPADAERFKDGVANLVHHEPMLSAWLSEHNFNVMRLFEEIEDQGTEIRGQEIAHNDPEQLITLMAGDVAMGGTLGQIDIIRLARTAHYLLGQVRYYAGFEAKGIVAEAVGILGGAA